VNCNTVANITHIRYGILIRVIHFAYGYIANRAHIKVVNTKNISKEARRLFFNPNCTYVKIKLKNRFKINGNAIQNEIFFS
jgi:hypothetical protein